MASPPKLRALPTEALQDSEDVAALATRLSEILGPFLSDTGVAFDDLLLPNRREQVEEGVVFTTTAGSALTNVRFKIRLPFSPKSVELGQIRPTAASSSLTLTVGNPVWHIADGNIVIDHIGGLTASTQYKATFKVS